MKNLFLVCLSLTCFWFCTPIQENNTETKTDSAKVYLLPQKDTLTSKTDSLHSEITCPDCGFKKVEELPTEICLLKYTCQKCKKDLFPKDGDCCVYCSYGNVKCPSKQ